jgi:hypothetical protein
MAQMIKALKSAAESYIGQPITVVSFTIPLLPAPKGQHLLDTALRSAGLNRTAQRLDAGHHAATANYIGAYYQNGGRDFRDSSMLLLTVDYTRSALTAFLYFQEDGVFDIVRTEHHIEELGAGALGECRASTDIAHCLRPLKDTFRRLVKMPINGYHWPSDSEVPNRVSDVILLGDKGHDPRVSCALPHVLSKQICILPKIAAQSQGQGIVSPRYASARGAAFASCARQNDRFRKEL